MGGPRTVYRSPANRFVADFIGETNWMTAHVVRCAQGLMDLETRCGVLHVAAETAVPVGGRVSLGIRPEAVDMGPGPCNSFETCIRHVTYLGEIEQYRLELPSGEVIKAFEQNPQEIRQVGASLTVHIRPENFLVLPES